jgi:hypothetical protein
MPTTTPRVLARSRLATIQIRCSLDSVPHLDGSVGPRVLDAMLDCLALAIVITAEEVHVVGSETVEAVLGGAPVLKTLGRRSTHEPPQAVMWRHSGHHELVRPPSALLQIVRSQTLELRSVQYQNPWLATVLAAMKASHAERTVRAIAHLFTIPAEVRTRNAESRIAEAKALVAQSTIPLEIEAQIVELRRAKAEVDDIRESTNLKRALQRRIAAETAELEQRVSERTELASSLLRVREQMPIPRRIGLRRPDEMESLIDDSRILGSIGLVQQFGMSATIEPVDDRQTPAG